MNYGIYGLCFLKSKRLPLRGGNAENLDLALAIQHEMIRNGFEFSENAMGLLATTDADTLTVIYNDLVQVLDQLLDSEKYQTYYPNFPQLPVHRQYSGKAVHMEAMVQETQRLKLAIPIAEYVEVESAPAKYFDKLFLDVLYANQAPSKLDRQIIEFGVHYGIEFDFEKIPFQETQALVGKECFEQGTILSRNATTLLRIYSAWCGGDAGLKENVKFIKPSPTVREKFREALDRCYNLEESFKMYEEKWKRVLFYLRPGVHKNRYTQLFKYSDYLRNSPKKLRTFNSYVEEAIRLKDKGIFELLRKRKGVFARRLNQLIDVFGFKAFEEFMKYEHSAKRLVELYNYFEGRRTSQSRSAILANDNSSQMVSYGALAALKGELVDSIQESILGNFPKQLMGTTYIDPKLYYRPLTTNNRAQEVSLNPTVMGECFKIDTNTFRAFVHWEGKGVDIDFSGFLEGSPKVGMRKIGWNGDHSRPGIVYSGDNTGNYDFNAEYFDITFDKLERDVEWIVLDAVVFSRIPFSSIKNVKLGYCLGRKNRKFGKRFLRNEITQSQIVSTTEQQAWIAGIHVPTRTFISMGFTKAQGHVTSSASPVIGWLENNLNPETVEITWNKLNQGHILHLLSEKVVDDPSLASNIFTEDTTSEAVTSLI